MNSFNLNRAPKICVVIPAYKVSNQILDVVNSIGKEVTKIIVIDDACPEKSGELVKRKIRDKRVEVILLSENQGVGAAVITGYKRALETNQEIVVKVDGDGQMNLDYLNNLIAPILGGRADYTKGNRFYNIEQIRKMPKIRIFGNLLLSFFSKVSSGYWNVFDPTNGFTAITCLMLKNLQLEKIEKRFFFESDMLFRLYLSGAKVIDVPMEPKYANEVSNLKIPSSILEFSTKHTKNFFKRIFYVYYLRDFTIASIELPLGLALGIFGFYIGLSSWLHSAQLGIPTESGTQILVAISLLASIQFILSFISFDTKNYPQ